MNLLLLALSAACVLLSANAQSLNIRDACVPSGSFVSGKDYFPNKVAAYDSKFWDIRYFKTYKILRNEIAGESYVLYQCGTTPPAAEKNKGHTHFIPVPLRNGIALSSTTIIPYFALLGRRASIKAWMGSPDYISSPCLKKLIAQGSTDVVRDTKNTTRVNALKKKFGQNIVSFHNYRSGYKSSLFNVTDSSYLEANNVAIFEWLKFLAVFFNEEKKANAIYTATKLRYRCYAEESLDAVSVFEGGVKPKLIWASYTNYNNADGWAVAECPNYYCEYASKCSADLISSRAGTIDYFGSKLFTTKDFVALAKDAPNWIYPSSNWDEAYAKHKTLLDTMASVKSKNVFDTTASGENAWFEDRLAEFDVVLQDVCAVVGTADPLHKRKFMRNVFTERPGLAAVKTCPNPSAALVTRATPCRKYEIPVDSGCFSGETVVELKGGMSIQMKDLRIGDMVETGDGKFTRVYSFGHSDADAQGTFLQLYTNSTLARSMPIEISAGHLIFVGKHALPAGSVKVGDIVRLGNGENGQIVDIKPVIRTGVFAPFTDSGTIVVNGIVASNYLSLDSHTGDMTIGGWKVASYHWVSHLALAPHRLYCLVAARKCEKESYTDDGIAVWAAAPLRASQWWRDQNTAVKALVMAPVLIFLLFMYGAEMFFKYPWMIALFVALAFRRKIAAAKTF